MSVACASAANLPFRWRRVTGAEHPFEENVFLQRRRRQRVKSSSGVTRRLEKDGSAPGPWSTAPYSLASVSGTLIPLCQTNHIHTVLGSRPIVSFPVYQAPILCHRIRSWLCKFFRGRVGMELRGPSEPHRSSFWLWPFLGGSQASVLDTVCSLISWNRT